MFYVIMIVVLFFLLLIAVSVKLKTWRQRLLLWLGVFAGIPLLCFAWYKWAVWQGQKKLERAEKECAAKTSVDELTLYFTGFSRSDFPGSNVQTIRKDLNGTVRDSSQQVLQIEGKYEEEVFATYHYNQPFATTDILEIRLGKKNYVLRQFTQRALYFGSMLGAPTIVGCVIDSATINDKRVPFGQNMIIHKTDGF